MTISSDITHHLLPEKNKWIIKKSNNDDRLVLEMSKTKAVKVMIHDTESNFQDVY